MFVLLGLVVFPDWDVVYCSNPTSLGGSYKSALGHLFFKTKDMVQAVEALDSVRNKVSFFVFRFLDGEYRISNIRYNVSSGERYPVPDKSTPVYITVRDGGNQKGLSGSYGHSTLEIQDKTHAFYHWNHNDDGKKVATDSFVLHNQYCGLVKAMVRCQAQAEPPRFVLSKPRGVKKMTQAISSIDPGVIAVINVSQFLVPQSRV
ncbi:hypothetical protein J1N35_025268 [Gossypium stocksii]|uniref:Uncharacterized protein n=1 Tax=Gossypium stocksii TaxID=47602 RepID=A0A9D3V690_9ROSI|nr:hypothetical protein J1N35_025268 [Gossypium stocksii]